MRAAYRMFLRGDVYYIQNNSTGEQKSLRTRDKREATRLLNVHNEPNKSVSLNLELGRAYIRAADPTMAERTWQVAMDELSSHGVDSTRSRYQREMKSKAYDSIRRKCIVETNAEDLRLVLKRGGAATNHFLRRLHNLALGHGWIVFPIIPPKQWEKPPKTQRRAITFEEHAKILASEHNIERHRYYQMLWHIGAAQMDCALLTDKNINRAENILFYQRQKTGEWCHLKIGAELARLIELLPSEGYLFPTIAATTSNARSAEFSRRCRVAKVTGVSLHSYRYAWAERAASAGYPERFAQAALGHSSKAVHRAYAKAAKIVCPALEGDGSNIISFRLAGQGTVEPMQQQAS